MNEKDIDAGRSIDPTKPGPDDVTRSSGNVFADLGLPDADKLLEEAKIRAQSDAEPVAWPTEPECRRALKDAKDYIESSIFNIPSKEKTDEILSEIDTALAQSDIEPSTWQLVPKNPTQEMLDAADHAPDDDDWQAAMAKAYKAMLAAAPVQSDEEPEWNCATQGCKNADTIEGLTGCAVKYRAKLKELESALAQSDAEPVCIVHNREEGFKEVVVRDTAAIYDNNPRFRLVEEIFDFDHNPLGFRVYNAPSRPDASAGLIEAAEMAEECSSECLEDRKAPLSAYALRDFAKLLRARAADRSGR